MLILFDDIPGIIGKISAFIGKHDVNIAELQVARDLKKEVQLMMLKTDQEVSTSVLEELKRMKNIHFLNYYSFE